MLNRFAYENSRPDGFAVLEVVDLKSEARLFVPLKRTELSGEIAGPLASLNLRQVFGYSRRQCEQVIEAVYRFPLPGDAAILRVRVRFGEVELDAQLKDRQAAELEYGQAKREGRQAALATRESADVFTLHVAGIQPDEDVVVETTYAQLARVEQGLFTLRIPLTTAPRYVRADEAGARHAEGQPLAVMRDPGHRFSLDIRWRHAQDVSSPTHALDLSTENGSAPGLRARLRAGEVLPNRDCVLRWRLQQSAHASLRVLTHAEPSSGWLYFLALVSPPAAHGAQQSLPREAIVLVDHSGSMEGPKWQAADWAVKQFLWNLTGPQSGTAAPDTFNLGLFHSHTRWLFEANQAATAESVGVAVSFLEEHRDSGGTELGVALEQAVSLPRDRLAPHECSRHVLVVTDAQVSDAARLLRVIEAEAQRPAQGLSHRRVSLLCIDAAPNSYLVFQMADRGGGVARFLTSRPDEEDITSALEEILADWNAPLYAGLRLRINRPGAQLPRGQVHAHEGTSWIDLGDLPAGRATWVCGRVPLSSTAAHDAPLELSIEDARGARLDGVTASPGEERPAVKALFGAQRLMALEFLLWERSLWLDTNALLRQMGYDPSQLRARETIYSENAFHADRQLRRDLLVRESLEFGLPCSETAFVAARRERGKLVESTICVANAAPEGWPVTERFGYYPAGGVGVASLADSAPSAVMFQRTLAQSVTRAHRSFDLSAPAAMHMQRVASRRYAGDMSDRIAAPAPTTLLLFEDTPVWPAGEDAAVGAVLFDSDRPVDAAKLPQISTVLALAVEFPGGWPGDVNDLQVQLYVDDLARPHCVARLADLKRTGKRPLNIWRTPTRLRIVLSHTGASGPPALPRLRLSLLCLAQTKELAH